MAFKYSVECRNAGLDARIACIGQRPLLKIYATAQGTKPVVELVSMALPAEWMGKAKNGTVMSVGEWKGRATTDGEAKSFRIYDRSGDICHIDGAIPDEMKLDNENIAVDQTVTVAEFTIRSGNG
jgi:hypothetical protein